MDLEEPEEESKEEPKEELEEEVEEEVEESSGEAEEDIPKEYQSALRKAEIYANKMHMSKLPYTTSLYPNTEKNFLRKRLSML